VMDAEGNELAAQNADEPFVPASVTKIVTAWLAMEVLGGDYRFVTRFYVDGKRVLYVHGGGDPFLISEELASLATKLVAAVGKEPITGIVLDASYYPSNLRIPGIEDTDEAYNALNSALAVNFNTINAVRSGNTVRSAEKQTPITPLAITQFRLRGPRGTGRISLSQDPAVSLQYAGELIAAFIERAGGSVKGKISTGTVPEGLKPVYVHRQSRTLSEILGELLRASNNYIANQVFLEIGGHRLGGPVSLEKSLQVANEMLAAHGLAAAIHLEEGSGISRNNHFTARGLAKVLELFAPHAALLHGHDGGMNKTGTMEGVRTLAGYADTSSHGRVRVVISLTSNDGEMRFRLLRAVAPQASGRAPSGGGGTLPRCGAGAQIQGGLARGLWGRIACFRGGGAEGLRLRNGAGEQTMRQGSLSIALLEGDDLDPIRALAGRKASDRLERTALGIDRVRRDCVRLLAGNNNEAAGRVDAEAAGLFLGWRASKIGELSALGFDAERAERARRTLGGIEKAAVRRKAKIRSPDVIVRVPRGRAGRSDCAARHAGHKLGVGGQRRNGIELLERPGIRIQGERGDRGG
jgi:D-alanyl-D-alanine carboxypeptidase/D-alanyl-D-alanine-endopeptidase (penicillin-binding protein 4)